MNDGAGSTYGPKRGIQPPTQPTTPSPALPTQTVGNGVIVACEECGKPFRPGTTWSRFCGDRCRLEAWSLNHIRVHKADMLAAYGKDWQAKLAAARLARKAKEMMR
jgi:endogenous inhibitor of DNA gyrase (YacG/DUF329 family)